MSSTIDHRPPGPGSGSGPEDPTGRFAAVPGPSVPRQPPHAPWQPPHPPYGQPGPFPGYVPPGVPVPAPRPGHRGLVFGVVGAVVVLVLLLASAISSTSTTTVPGSVTLRTTTSLTPGSSCWGVGTWSWLHAGAPVTIYDASGTVVGTTTLGSGTAVYSGTGWSSSYADSCVFSFTLNDVPARDDFYRVKAGSMASDGVTFTGEQIRTGGAHIEYGGGSSY